MFTNFLIALQNYMIFTDTHRDKVAQQVAKRGSFKQLCQFQRTGQTLNMRQCLDQQKHLSYHHPAKNVPTKMLRLIGWRFSLLLQIILLRAKQKMVSDHQYIFTPLNELYTSSHLSFRVNIMSIMQIRKLKLRMVESSAQGLTVSKLIIQTEIS